MVLALVGWMLIIDLFASALSIGDGADPLSNHMPGEHRCRAPVNVARTSYENDQGMEPRRPVQLRRTRCVGPSQRTKPPGLIPEKPSFLGKSPSIDRTDG